MCSPGINKRFICISLKVLQLNSLFSSSISALLVSATILFAQTGFTEENPAQPSSSDENVSSLIAQGRELYEKQQYQPAREVFRKVVAQARSGNDRQGEGQALRFLGAIFIQSGEYSLARERGLESLGIAEEISDHSLRKNALNLVGLSYSLAEEYAKSIEYFTMAVAIPVSSPTDNWRALDNLGQAYYWLEDYNRAVDAFTQALWHAESSGIPIHQAITLKNIGDSLFWNNEVALSVHYFKQALSLADVERYRGSIHINLANAYSSSSEYILAVVHFKKAIDIFDHGQNTFVVANAYIGMAITYKALNNSADAIRHAQKAIELAEENDHPALAANAYGVLAGVVESQNMIEQATQAYEQALKYAKATEAKEGRIAATLGLANIHIRQGNYLAAHDALRQLQDLTQSDYALHALSLANLGSLYLELGDYGGAIATMKNILEVAQKGEDIVALLKAHENLGNTYYTAGHYHKAGDHYHMLLSLAQKHSLPVYQAGAMANLSWVHGSLTDFSTAKQYAAEAVRLSSEIDDPVLQGKSLHARISIQTLTADPEVIDSAKAFLQLSKQTTALSPIIAMEILADAYKNSGDNIKAIELYQNALKQAQSEQDLQLVGSISHSLGVIYHKVGDLSAAEKIIRQALAIWESLRERLDDRDKFRVSLLHKQRTAYQDLLAVLVESGKIHEALEVSERGRARALAELMKRQYVALTDTADAGDIPTVSEMVALAREQRITIIEYATTLTNVYIWVIRPDGSIAFEKVDMFLPSAVMSDAAVAGRFGSRSNKINTAIAKTRAAIILDDLPDGDNAEENIDLGLRTLYDLLIKPVAMHLPKDPRERVIFIPQGPLFQVPFPALMDMEGRFLIEHHTIQTATSIQLLTLSKKRRNAQRASVTSRSGLTPLIVGNPAMPTIIRTDSKKPLRLSNLPGAEQEALAIASKLKSVALIGNNASEPVVTKKLMTASIAHFATHGLLDYGASGSSGVWDIPGAIALAPGTRDQGRGGDGLLTSGEIMNLKIPAELVILSACDTARGDVTADGVVGLSRAFLQQESQA